MNDEDFCGWNENPSRIVIAMGAAGKGCIVWRVGSFIENEIEATSTDLSDLGLDDAPIGISIWEGIYVYRWHGYPGEEETDSDPSGAFRPPTPEEWALIQQNKAPWNEKDWWAAPPEEEKS